VVILSRESGVMIDCETCCACATAPTNEIAQRRLPINWGNSGADERMADTCDYGPVWGGRLWPHRHRIHTQNQLLETMVINLFWRESSDYS